MKNPAQFWVKVNTDGYNWQHFPHNEEENSRQHKYVLTTHGVDGFVGS
jgi:hypothetical protein